MQNPFEKKRGYSPKGLQINSRPKGCLYSSYNKGTGLSPRSQFLPSFKLTLGNKFPESVIHIGCTPLLLLLWNPLVFCLFFTFGPYFKWILSSFERKGEKKKVRCRENSFCRGAVMKERDMRSSLLAVQQTFFCEGVGSSVIMKAKS